MPERGQEAFGGLNLDASGAADDEVPETDCQGTPPELARDLKTAIGGRFDVDPCSGAEPEPIAHTRYTEADDGLAADSPWFGTVFVNPPYSDAEPWARKAVQAVQDRDADLVAMLLPSYSASSGWFHEWCGEADYACLIDGRLRFYGADGTAPFASLLVVLTDGEYTVPTDLLRTLDEWGDLYENLGFDRRDDQARFAAFLDSSDNGGENEPLTEAHPDDPPLAGLARGDLLSTQFDAQIPGFPDDLAANLTVKALSGRTIDGRVEVLTVAPDVPWGAADGDTYILLSHPEEEPWDVRAAIEEPGHGWQHLIVESVVSVAAERRASGQAVPSGEL